MITTFNNEKNNWYVRQFITILHIPLACIIIVFVSPIYESSLLLTVLILGAGIAFFVSDLQGKRIFSMVFDDEKGYVKIAYIKYSHNLIESYIPYDKLWYVKVRIKSDILSGSYSGFSIRMQEKNDSPPQIKFVYIQTKISGAFSEKQFHAILDKLTEVGSELF